MTKAEKLFHEIAEKLPDAKESKMFGSMCIKAPNGKAVAMLWKDEMVFKLSGKEEEDAMKLKGAHVFSPAMGKTMGGWIQIPAAHSGRWYELAEKSMSLVKKIEVAPKKTPRRK